MSKKSVHSSGVPLPDNEFQRLKKLHEYDLLDTPPDEDFDRLTKIAKRQLNADAAAVTFLDEDRQFMKSASGCSPADTPRDETFCTYTILSDELNVINDTREDDRFPENYAVSDGQEIRSYAGAPLITKEGYRLGAFCVFSFEPREFQEEELELLGLLRDQTMALINSRHHEKQLYQLSHFDPITGFPNRRRFMKELKEQFWNVTDPDQIIAVGHLDLTRFDRVADTLGYEARDEVLGTVADRLREKLPDSSLQTRVSGDEFLLTLREIAGREEARNTFEEALEALTDPISVGDQSFLFSARIGISLYPSLGQTAHTLLRQSSFALKQTSAEKCSTLQFYLSEMYGSGSSTTHLEKDFLQALEENRLTLNYQPKVDLEDRSVAGSEALIRWEHPDEGLIPPPAIVSLAETLGKMAELGRTVMEQACRQTRNWNQRHDLDLSLGVNVSALEFQQGEQFIQTLENILASTGLDHENLIVEITETEAMDDLNFTVELLEKLTDRSVKIAVDDFGTGQSSLQYLAKFPDPLLKIDQAFIDGVTRSRTKKAIVKSTLNLAKEMDLATIAEGVEHKEEEDFLREAGCDFYQGFYFSKPVDANTFEETFL